MKRPAAATEPAGPELFGGSFRWGIPGQDQVSLNLRIPNEGVGSCGNIHMYICIYIHTYIQIHIYIYIC